MIYLLWIGVVGIDFNVLLNELVMILFSLTHLHGQHLKTIVEVALTMHQDQPLP